MRAMVLHKPGGPLLAEQVARPEPGPGEVLLRVLACGVCRTDLHLVDGELKEPKLPIIPGHQVVGEVVAQGTSASRLSLGDWVGVGWLANTCGTCERCQSTQENLCPNSRFTGYQKDGGFAEYTCADERFCYPLPRGEDPLELAPLLCGGAVGYRALRLSGNPRRLGFYGFGASAHLLIQLARAEGKEVFAFTRPKDQLAQALARALGAVWAGGSDETPTDALDAAIVFAPVGSLVPAALASVRPGGTVVCAGIHMSDLPAMPYSLLWGERVLRSVANLTRRDAEDFLALAAQFRIRPQVQRFALQDANEALEGLRFGRISGTAVLELGLPPST